MALIILKAVPASSKPSVGFDVRIAPDEKHGVDASAPSSTRAPSLHIGRAGGSVSSPKLVLLVGPSLTLPGRRVTLVLHSICCSALCTLASLVVCFYPAPVTRRGC